MIQSFFVRFNILPNLFEAVSFLTNLKNRGNISMLTDSKCVRILSLPYRKKIITKRTVYPN